MFKALTAAALPALACLVLAGVTAQPAQAQSSGGAKVTDVRVVSAVQQKTPWNLYSFVTLAPGQSYAEATGNAHYTVPAGKVLVIETGNVFTSADDFSVLRLVNQSNNRIWAVIGAGPMVNTGRVSNVAIQGRLEAGETTAINVSATGTTGSRTVFFIFNGYLEPAQ